MLLAPGRRSAGPGCPSPRYSAGITLECGCRRLADPGSACSNRGTAASEIQDLRALEIRPAHGIELTDRCRIERCSNLPSAQRPNLRQRLEERSVKRMAAWPTEVLRRFGSHFAKRATCAAPARDRGRKPARPEPSAGVTYRPLPSFIMVTKFHEFEIDECRRPNPEATVGSISLSDSRWNCRPSYSIRGRIVRRSPPRIQCMSMEHAELKDADRSYSCTFG